MSDKQPDVHVDRTRRPARGGCVRTPIQAKDWKLAWLFATPHRIAFACGGAGLAASSIWWSALAIAQWQGRVARLGLPIVELHGLLMVFSFMPFFFAGFLFTAVPKWLGCRPPSVRELGGPLSAQVAGWIVFMIGVQATHAAFAAAVGGLGLAAVALGWTQLWLGFARMVRRSKAEDKTHAAALAFAAGVGALALWAAAVGVTASDHAVVRAATQAALWIFVGGTFVAAAHRMVPFFGAAAFSRLDAWCAQWLLFTVLSLFCLEGLSTILDSVTSAPPPPIQNARALLELTAGLGLSALVVRWGFQLNLRIRLVAMLHAAFAWLAIAFVLSGLSHFSGAGAVPLGAAPLHAYTMGFLGSTLLAMVTRITCAQTGRAVVADDFLWSLFWVLQAAIILRLCGGVATALGAACSQGLIAAAAFTWAVWCIAWAMRYISWFGRPRQDGRAG